MSAPLGTYAFLPWMRRGVSTQITRVDGTTTTAAYAEMEVGLSINDGTLNTTTRLALFGPGEVTGIDPRSVIRTWPRADVYDAESNYFPLIEFDQADLPWRYTPARPTTNDRLRPWMCLIVLKDDEVSSREVAGANRPLPVITVTSAAVLPLLEQSWAWAHVQVSGVKTIDPATAASLITSSPQRFLSRLLCPRRLDARTAYTAFLVPTFERGRRAGLGEAVGDIDALTPAWTTASSGVRLPVYYQWRFQTGVEGDFEYLVRLLMARALPPTVGIRDMDVRNPGAGLPDASTAPLGMEGALMTPSTVSTAWDATERTTWIDRLKALLNRPAELLASALALRVVAPPLYGRWHAARDTLDMDARPPWFQELNSDPRLRSSAGLGTLVVQDQQQQLMASAWRQVEGIRKINERMRLAQLAREISTRLYERHVRTADDETSLLLTAPVHARVLGSPVTVKKLLQESPVSNGAFEPQLRRVMRPLGPLGRRQGRAERPRSTDFLNRLNRGELSPAPVPPTPSDMVTPARAGAKLVPDWATPERLSRMRRLRVLLIILAVIFFLLAIVLPIAGLSWWFTVGAVAVGAASTWGALYIQRRVKDAERRIALRDGNVTAEQIEELPARSDFVVTETAPGTRPTSRPAPVGLGLSGEDSASAREFRHAAAAMFTSINVEPAPARELVSVNLAQLNSTMMTALDPRTTIAATFAGRLRFAPGLVWQPDDPIEPVMAAPEFRDPMYKPLAKLSQDWVLPGLDKVLANTISLLKTNQRFVEAYMVGLNHEMSRELLWNEYPTDQRGTYFRQFWDSKGYVGRPGETIDVETLKDIKPIHTWRSSAQLGDNTSRRPMPEGEHLVLLVRGELLRRYPNTIVYAVRARLGSSGRRELGAEERHPVFSGLLEPDVSFFGFELSAEQVRGTTARTGDQGWFFVLQEQPSEPRFGLDLPQDGAFGNASTGTSVVTDISTLSTISTTARAGSTRGLATGRARRFSRTSAVTSISSRPTSWNDLAWSHLAESEGALSAINYIDLNAQLPDTRAVADPGGPGAAWHAESGLGPSGTHSSDLAYITLQRPVRIAVHGSDMLLSL